MTIAEQLKKEREKCKLTHEELAKKAAINIDTIRRIENEKNLNPTIYVIRQLQKALNIKFEI